MNPVATPRYKRPPFPLPSAALLLCSACTIVISRPLNAIAAADVHAPHVAEPLALEPSRPARSSPEQWRL
jgi:hypothetical protein